MQHQSFRLNALISAIMSGIGIGCYLYYSIIDPKNIQLQICFKIVPLSFMICLNVLYMLIYKASTYAILTLMSLILSLLGDVFVSINNVKFLYSGASCFLVARIIWAINWSLYNNQFIKYNFRKTSLIHIASITFYLSIGVSLIMYKCSLLTGMMLVYILFGMPIQLSSAFLRIKRLDHESIYSSWFTFIGIILFNFADIVLFLYMVVKLPEYIRYSSDILYWISMFLLTISLVRTNSELKERSLFFSYITV